VTRRSDLPKSVITGYSTQGNLGDAINVIIDITCEDTNLYIKIQRNTKIHNITIRKRLDFLLTTEEVALISVVVGVVWGRRKKVKINHATAQSSTEDSKAHFPLVRTSNWYCTL
jgi:hypothetical protein